VSRPDVSDAAAEVGKRLSREERCALLAEARPAELQALADACLADDAEVRVLLAPEVGCVTAQVREPVAGHRFQLGDVLACRAEVELAGQRGWAMRLGDDRVATLAAAVLDAEAEAGRPGAARWRRCAGGWPPAARSGWSASGPSWRPPSSSSRS
jgi:alpha-D-ribose 1-methylphosphonate 5-triphosphate synthase subunit PhnG